MSDAAIDRPLTRGAGVDPRKVIRPGKRIKHWWREGRREGESLRSFVRSMTVGDPVTDAGRASAATAARWLASKGARP